MSLALGFSRASSSFHASDATVLGDGCCLLCCSVAEVVDVLRRRLEVNSFRVQLLTLTLVETLVKNCGSRFHRALATEKYMNTMKAVVKVLCFHAVCVCRWRE